MTQARVLGMKRVACASTGNTSSSLAAYAAWSGLRGILLFQDSHIALGKLAQAIAYGAICIRIAADFDRNLELVRQMSDLGIYVVNSVNPFRLEGQKSIVIEAIQQLRWNVPDWIVLPGGNLGNTSAFGKALHELYALGLIDRMPSLAVIQAEGANPLYRSYKDNFATYEPRHAETIASAIKIGNPVNYPKAVRSLQVDGRRRRTGHRPADHGCQSLIDAQGIGCEPASACTLAGLRKLVDAGVIKSDETVVGLLTGHLLKDPEATIAYHEDRLEGIISKYPNHVYTAEPSIESIREILDAQELAHA